MGDSIEGLKEALAETESLTKHRETRLIEIEGLLSKYQGLLEERQNLTMELQMLRDEERGLKLALRRRQGLPLEDHGLPTTPDREWATLTRPEAVQRVMRELGQPMSPAQIAEVLQQRGRDDGHRGVSVVLARLSSKGRVRHGARGEWVLAEGGDATPDAE